MRKLFISRCAMADDKNVSYLRHFLSLTLFGDCSVTSGGGLHKAEASCRGVGRLYRGLAAAVLWAGRRPRGKNGDEMAGSER